MPSIYSMLDISRWAVNAATRQLNVVSHNVANANTEGYSRQEAVQGTRTPEDTGQGYYGRGVKILSVIQHVDKLILARMTDKISSEQYNDSRLAQLKRLEALSNEATDSGLGKLLTDFFKAWQDVANSPESTAVRRVLAQTSQNLVDRFHTMMRDLEQVRRDLDTYLAEAVEEVNSACRRIAELNRQIVADEAGGKSANDLRDERQRQIEKLAEYLDIQWFEVGDGSVTVFTGSGNTLVQDDFPRSGDDVLAFQQVSGYSQRQVIWRGSDVVLGPDQITGGKIGAWLKVRGGCLPTSSTATDTGDIPQTQSFLNDLAETIIWEVNKLHSQGVGLTKFTRVTGTYASPDATTDFNDSSNTLPFADKIQSGSFELWVYESGTRRKYTITVNASDDLQTLVNRINDTINPSLNANINPVATLTDNNTKLMLYASGGIEFAFRNDTSNVLAALGINTFFTGNTATGIGLNDTITGDVRYITAGRLTSDGEHALGDNSNALELADLKDTDTMDNDSQTFNEAVISWASSLGTDISTTDSSLSFAQTTLNELKNLRDSVSAVNLDEEMVKMIRYQRAYQMAAKMISVADSLLATLLETKR